MMAERWRINLALAAIAGLLAWLVANDLQRELSSGRLTDLEPGAISRVALERGSSPAIRLERREDGWWMRAPIEAPADAERVQQLLAIARAPVARVLPAEAAAAGRLGLEPPRVRLSLDGLALDIGDADPIAQRLYVRTGDLIQLIDDQQLPWLLAPPERLLSRRLLPQGFSPGLGRIDGRPLSADALAGLVGVEAERVEPLQGELSGRVLVIESADGGDALRFLVAEGGSRWSRLDQRLSYWFRQRPLVESDIPNHE
jgi:hypothetical protein